MKILAKNKKAFHDYEILKKLEAGIVLIGSEVKSIKNGQINLKGSFVYIQNSEAWLENAHIAPYRFSSEADYNPTRKRKLLLKKGEIFELSGLANQKGATIIPLEVYLKKGLIKILIGTARGKKKYDKRAAIKKREIEREMDKSKKIFSRG